MADDLKKGDRVRVYCARGVFIGCVETPAGMIKVNGPPAVLVMPDRLADKGQYGWYHPKQCRRMRPKRKAREMWGWLPPTDEGRSGWCMSWATKANAMKAVDIPADWKLVHFREVLPAKREGTK